METTIEKATRLRGTVRVPGDKSVAHRALIFGAMARGTQQITNLPPSEDVASTAACLRSLGCRIEELPDGRVQVTPGTWIRGQSLDAGNSGTTARLLSGLVAGHDLDCTIDGDASLRRRALHRLAVRGEVAGKIVAFPKGRDVWLRKIGRARGRGTTDAALCDTDDEQLLALLAWAPPHLRRRIQRYALQDRLASLPITGDDLVTIGIRGPAVGRALSRIRVAFLDRAVRDRDEALALAREIARRGGRKRVASGEK